METYWNKFMKKYKNRLIHISLSQTLEAFWHYCHIDVNKKSEEVCNDIMQNKNHKNKQP